jgi:hypothetical protein
MSRTLLHLMCALGLLWAAGCVETDDDDTVAGDDDATADDDDTGDDDTTPVDTSLVCSDVEGDEVCFDPASGLSWLREGGDVLRSWQASVDHCEGVTLAAVEDWRIPTIGELRTLIRECPGTEAGGACGVTDDCAELACYGDDCGACDAGSCHWDAALDGPCDASHWSGSTVVDSEATAWFVGFYSGGLINDPKDNESYVRCVRDGEVR